MCVCVCGVGMWVSDDGFYAVYFSVLDLNVNLFVISPDVSHIAPQINYTTKVKSESTYVNIFSLCFTNYIFD